MSSPPQGTFQLFPTMQPSSRQGNSSNAATRVHRPRRAKSPRMSPVLEDAKKGISIAINHVEINYVKVNGKPVAKLAAEWNFTAQVCRLSPSKVVNVHSEQIEVYSGLVTQESKDSQLYELTGRLWNMVIPFNVRE
ncbi:conserved proline-rich protein [Arthroderma uncinatum]|uniref:conserved proline-rich protein n=1 Tax=Arthroderma uncinatum TaxID=74035 RepID=UPI00144AB2F5|nr:conserved proline-rich protein [Arthroderma uncinatum]KAF3492271.1 conserved proline-rich protein [Arthroderma uncinatum]